MAVFALVVGCDDGGKKKKVNTTCGDGVREGTEVCDDLDLGDADCVSQGFSGGVLGCLADCTGFDTTACTNTTNNTTPGHVGDPCMLDEQCITDMGSCYAEVGYGMPSGYCVSDCTGEGGCYEENNMCVSAGGVSFCARTCDLELNDCRTGYQCYNIGEPVGVCWPKCTTGDHCTVTGICDDESGFCMTPPEVCDDEIDNDFDGLVDCEDPDCDAMPACGCPEDEYNNHSGPTAHTMDLSSIPANLSGHICGPAHEDWFRLSPATSFAGIVRLNFTHSNGDLDLVLTDSNFDVIGYSYSVTDVEQINYDFVGGSTYYVIIEGYAGATGDYELTVEYAPARIDADIVAVPSAGTPGGSVALQVTLTNTGGLDASTVAATLTSADSSVTITDGAASFGDIVPGANASNGTDALTFDISAEHKNNQPVALTLTVTAAGGGEWTFPVAVPVPFPVLKTHNLVINDATGNDDGYADPGEDTFLEFHVINDGALVASGPITVLVEIHEESTVGGILVVPPANTVCSVDPLAAGAHAACEPWGLNIPENAVDGDIAVVVFRYTDGDGNEWSEIRNIQVGPATYMSLLTQPDPQGDNGSYACDLKDLLAYVDAAGIMHIKTEFHSACNLTGIHDIYMHDGSNYITLTLENNARSIWSRHTGSWTQVGNPASFVINPLSGSTSELEYHIAVADIPHMNLASNSVQMYAAVIPDWNEWDYTDYAPDSEGDMPWVNLSW